MSMQDTLEAPTVATGAGNGGGLAYRQFVRPLQLGGDDDAVGDIQMINTAAMQTGQWYAPYRGSKTHFSLAIVLSDSGPRSIRVDSVRFYGFNLGEGRVTYDTTRVYDGSVEPAYDQRPLHATLVTPTLPLTVVVPLPYPCAPRSPQGAFETVDEVQVTWALWGEHHTQWMALPQRLTLTGGQACPGHMPPGASPSPPVP